MKPYLSEAMAMKLTARLEEMKIAEVLGLLDPDEFVKFVNGRHWLVYINRPERVFLFVVPPPRPVQPKAG